MHLYFYIKFLQQSVQMISERLIVRKTFCLYVIAIPESWLTNSNLSTYNLNGYHSTHSVRQNCKGGGISLFVHESICGITPKVLVDVVTPDLNQFLIVELQSVNTTIAVPYRRPDSRDAER